MCERQKNDVELPHRLHRLNVGNGRDVRIGHRAVFGVDQPFECRLSAMCERQQVAGPCPSLTGDEQAAGPRPTIDSGCVDENRTDLSRDSCHPTTHAPVSILLQPRTKKISPLVSAARSDFLFCRGSGSSNPRDGALMVCRRRRRPRHLIRFHQINVCVRPHSSDLCQKKRHPVRGGVSQKR